MSENRGGPRTGPGNTNWKMLAGKRGGTAKGTAGEIGGDTEGGILEAKGRKVFGGGRSGQVGQMLLKVVGVEN